MSEPSPPSPPGAQKTSGIDLGVFAKATDAPHLGATDLIALALSILWFVAAGIFFLVLGVGNGGAETYAVVILAVILPIAMIWIAAMAAKSARAMQDEADRMHAAIDAMRQSAVTQAQNAGTVLQPSVEKKLDEIAQAQRKTDAAIATFASIRHVAEPVAGAAASPPALGDSDAQPSLALSDPNEPQLEPLAIEDFIVALNFPETADDRAGFRALRRAFQDPRAGRLVQASQDILTLISQDGIYMDDLTPDRARPELWRRFAQGERGRPIAALGGIRDRTSLAQISARMRRDTIFRDTAHHFLRTFDTIFAEFEKTASDEDIARLSDTRTARAFMLLGRATGTFD